MKERTLLLILFILSYFTLQAQSPKDSLFVFIGEQIKIESVPFRIDTFPDGRVSIPMDSEFNCEYRIIENIYNQLHTDTINFTAYDHYGVPAFTNYDFVMLFVSMDSDGHFYHQKYQFFNLYKTKKGLWASPYSAHDYNHPYLKDETDIKPERIDFDSSVSFDVSKFDEAYVKDRFPRKYYSIKKGKAYPKYGNYVPELFELKKRGILQARGIFSEEDEE